MKNAGSGGSASAERGRQSSAVQSNEIDLIEEPAAFVSRFDILFKKMGIIVLPLQGSCKLIKLIGVDKIGLKLADLIA